MKLAEKLLEDTQALVAPEPKQEATREDLYDAVYKALEPLKSIFLETDNKYGKEAWDVLASAMVTGPDEVYGPVMKAMQTYKRIAPKVDEE